MGKTTQENAGKENRESKDKGGKNKCLEGIITAIVVMVVLAIAVVGLWKLSGEGDKPSNVLVFTVGTEEVYLDEVNFCIVQNVLSLGITAENMQNTTAEDGTGAADHYKQQILELIMDYKVEYMIAVKQGLTLTEEEEKKIQNDVVAYLGEVDARILNQWGITQEVIEKVFRQRYLVSKLEDSVTENMEIEEQKYCTVYLLLFPKIEMAEDGNYVTEEDGSTPIMLSETEIEKRKSDAESALSELREGADIEEIAEEYGVAIYSGEQSNTPESFGEPFGQYAESLKDGEYSPVLETESCYAIVKMVNENNEEIASQLTEFYKSDVRKEFLQKQKENWYEELKVDSEPEYQGKVWEKISLYDYVQ